MAVFAYWLYGRVDLALVLFFFHGLLLFSRRHLRFYGAVTNAKTRQRPGTWRYGRFDRYHGYFGVFRVPWAGLATFDIRALLPLSLFNFHFVFPQSHIKTTLSSGVTCGARLLDVAKMASPSQSMLIASSFCRQPEVSPLRHNVLREREYRSFRPMPRCR